MQLENILPFAHSLLKQALKPDTRALDGTAGNGNDTLMLARSVGSGGKVWAFDVQEQALAKTRIRLEEAGMADRAELIWDGHENLATHIREPLKIYKDPQQDENDILSSERFLLFCSLYLPHSKTTDPPKGMER